MGSKRGGAGGEFLAVLEICLRCLFASEIAPVHPRSLPLTLGHGALFRGLLARTAAAILEQCQLNRGTTILDPGASG